MSIKTTRPITIAAVLPPWGSESTLQGIFGFAWNVAAAGAARLSPFALLYAHVTYEAEHGLVGETIAVRPGVFYRTGQRMQMVRLFCASSAAGANLAAFDVASEAEDHMGSVEPGRRTAVLYDSGAVIGTTALDSGDIETSGYRALTLWFDNVLNAGAAVSANVLRKTAPGGTTIASNGALPTASTAYDAALGDSLAATATWPIKGCVPPYVRVTWAASVAVQNRRLWILGV